MGQVLAYDAVLRQVGEGATAATRNRCVRRWGLSRKLGDETSRHARPTSLPGADSATWCQHWATLWPSG